MRSFIFLRAFLSCDKMRNAWRVIEVVITSRTRNAVVRSGHVGSNPTLSVLDRVKRSMFFRKGCLSMYQSVIFDLDGTLLNTLDDLTDSVNATLSAFCLPEKTRDDVRQAVGNGGRNLMRMVIPGGEAHPAFQEILDYYVPYYENHCRIRTRPYEGIMDLLVSLREKQIGMAIVSNKGDGAVQELASLYFDGIIDQAVGERDGIRRKPAPDSVLEAMRLLGSAPKETLYVGDSEVDHTTAINAGLDVALVTWGFRDRNSLFGLHPKYLIDHPGDLLHLF